MDEKERADKSRSCERKIRYFGRADAKRRLDMLKEEKGRRFLNAYPCRFCGGWHIGTSPKYREQASEARRLESRGRRKSGKRVFHGSDHTRKFRVQLAQVKESIEVREFAGDGCSAGI